MELGTYPSFFLPFFAFPVPCTFFGLPTSIPWSLSEASILVFLEVVVSASLVNVARFLVLGGGDPPLLQPLCVVETLERVSGIVVDVVEFWWWWL